MHTNYQQNKGKQISQDYRVPKPDFLIKRETQLSQFRTSVIKKKRKDRGLDHLASTESRLKIDCKTAKNSHLTSESNWIMICRLF